jgi:hypothetical protein
VESHLTLDVNLLSEKGCLRPGCSSTCQWIVSNEVVSINLRAEAERLSLSYNVQVGNGERQDIAETIPIVRLRCRFGVNGGQDRYRMRGRVSRLPGLTVGVVTHLI